MTDLDGAIHQNIQYKKTELQVGFGSHRGYFIGLGKTVTEPERCNICKGKRMVDGEDCRSCGASGTKDKTKVAILYQMGADLIDEEWVNYSLSGPGKLRNGSPKGATTLFKRMKNFSGGIDDEKQLAAWYKGLPKDENGKLRERIPIEIMVAENDSGNLVIASVRKLVKRSEPEHKPEPDFLDEEFA